jgi:hypothetical protein
MRAMPRFVFMFLVFSLFVWLSVSVYSQPLSSGIDRDKEYRIDKTEPNRMISDKHLTILGLTVMKNSLANLQAKLGKAVVIPGTEAMYPDTTCYISDNPADGTVLIFEVLGNKITGFKLLSNGQDVSNKEQCTKTSEISKKVSTVTGLKLGMKENELVSLMGPPTLKKKQTYDYFYETDQKIEGEEDFGDVLTYLYVTFADSKAIRIYIGKTITY